jgi:hypothetical protein
MGSKVEITLSKIQTARLPLRSRDADREARHLEGIADGDVVLGGEAADGEVWAYPAVRSGVVDLLADI